MKGICAAYRSTGVEYTPHLSGMTKKALDAIRTILSQQALVLRDGKKRSAEQKAKAQGKLEDR